MNEAEWIAASVTASVVCVDVCMSVCTFLRQNYVVTVFSRSPCFD